MHFTIFSADTYVKRRQQLCRALPDSLILFMGNEEVGMNYKDNVYPFRQDSTFLYYFGLDLPGLAALIDSGTGETIIFGNELSIDDIIWTGPLPSISEMAARVGVGATAGYDKIGERIQKAIAGNRQLHYLPPYRNTNKIRLAAWLSMPVDGVAAKASVHLIRAIVSQRAVKEAQEILAIEEAVDISVDMHLGAMQFAKPGMKEYEVAAKVQELAYAAGGRLAYNTICSVEGEVLHNHYYGNELKKGDLLLVDAGAEQTLHYAGDLTRTFPVGAPFTARQKGLYQIVLDALEKASSLLRPGTRYIDIHAKAAEALLEGLKSMGIVKGDPAEGVNEGAHTLFFQCGLGHMMGLDVHDMEDLGEQYVGYSEELKKRTDFGWKSLRLGRALEPGFVLTVEPGIYIIPELIDRWKAEKKLAAFIDYNVLEDFRHAGGIRIENNFHITPEGHRRLGKYLPMTVAEVEASIQVS